MSGWLVDTLVATTALIALVLVLREAVFDAFGPRIVYALWLLPALRMILPPLPAHWLPELPSLLPAASDGGTQPVSAALAGLVDTAGPAVAPVVPVAVQAGSSSPGIVSILLAVWLIGAALWFAVQMLRYHRFLSRALDGAVRLPTEGPIEIIVSPVVRGPLAAGIFRRRILLPPDFLTRYSPEERRLALGHEAAHHARRDILANLAALAMRAFHWWNPIAPAAYRRFRADQELACDATVLACADAEDRAAYGRALLKSAVPTMPALVAALDPKTELTRRIVMMTQKPYGRLRVFAGSALAAAMIGGGVMATASATAPKNPAAFAAVPAIPAVPSVPAAPAAPAMPSSMNTGPAIRAVPVPPSAPAAPAAPMAVASLDKLPAPPAPPAPPLISDASGRHVHVYRESDLTPQHREALREARQAAAEARREGEQARREAAQVRAEALRDAAEGRREGERARREAAQARAEALQGAAEARRQGEQARREAAQARIEAQQEAAEARRQGEAARGEAARARADAMRQAAAARGAAYAAAAQARNLEMHRAFAERDRVLRDIPHMVEASLAETRGRMAAQCAAKGVNMPASADFGALATCGEHLERTIRVALTSARAAIASSNDLSADQRANALKGLDQAISELGREPVRQ